MSKRPQIRLQFEVWILNDRHSTEAEKPRHAAHQRPLRSPTGPLTNAVIGLIQATLQSRCLHGTLTPLT